jgi:Cu/Ag efflux protein CusF
MKRIVTSLAIAGLVLAGVAQAEDKGSKAIVAGELARTTATVDAIDQTTRAVTLKDSSGATYSFVAGPEVKNLAQVSKGDVVTMEYGQAIAVSLDKTDNKVRERTVSENLKSAPVGQMPSASAVREVKVVASVEKIDTAKKLVTLRGPENTATVVVNDPAVLAKLKVGDFVKAVYTEAMAVRVDKAPAKK